MDTNNLLHQYICLSSLESLHSVEKPFPYLSVNNGAVHISSVFLVFLFLFKLNVLTVETRFFVFATLVRGTSACHWVTVFISTAHGETHAMTSFISLYCV